MFASPEQDAVKLLRWVRTTPGTINALPSDGAICRDLDCPGCGHPELGQTIRMGSGGTRYLYCRKCRRVATLHAGRPCGARHRFARYGILGSSSPVCVRCGEVNARYRPEGETHECA